MFPNQRAAEIAVDTVKAWLAETGSQMKVVFNVYKDFDLEIYSELLQQKVGTQYLGDQEIISTLFYFATSYIETQISLQITKHGIVKYPVLYQNLMYKSHMKLLER